MLEDEVIVLDFRTSKYFLGNRSAAHLWQQLVDGSTVEALAAALPAAYDISQEQAESDVRKLLDELSERDLLDGN